MNQDNDKQESRELDSLVSANYEKLADEKTPADLDRLVLREAARAVRADNRKGSFGAWFRPVAFMAMVGLSLAIILDLSDTSIFSPPADLSIDTAPPALAPPPPAATAADAVQNNRAQPTVSEMKRQKRSVSAQSLTVDAPDNGSDEAGVSKTRAAATEPLQPDRQTLQLIQSESAPIPIVTGPEEESTEDHAVVSDAFTVEVERAEQRVQETEANSGADLQSQPATAAQFTESQPAYAIQPLSIMTPIVCSDEQKSDFDEWWKCIETLRQSGLADAADRELESLREDFPDFEPPE